MLASIIGTPGCGRTVFLGLLYETMVQFTNSAENDGPGELRFIMEPQATKAFGDVRLDLLSGKWPSPEHKEEVSRCKMEAGFRRRGLLGLFPSKRFDRMSVQNVRIEERDASAIRSLDPNSLSEPFRDSLDSDVMVLLVDHSKLPSGDDPLATDQVREIDAFYAATIRTMVKRREWRRRTGTKMTRAHPVIFLTKFGPCGGETPGKGSGGVENVAREELLREHLPNTMEALTGGPAGKVRFDKVTTYISWLRTERGGDGTTMPGYKTDGGLVDLDYSREEYVSFIKQLGRTARRN